MTMGVAQKTQKRKNQNAPPSANEHPPLANDHPHLANGHH